MGKVEEVGEHHSKILRQRLRMKKYSVQGKTNCAELMLDLSRTLSFLSFGARGHGKGGVGCYGKGGVGCYGKPFLY